MPMPYHTPPAPPHLSRLPAPSSGILACHSTPVLPISTPRQTPHHDRGHGSGCTSALLHPPASPPAPPHISLISPSSSILASHGTPVSPISTPRKTSHCDRGCSGGCTDALPHPMSLFLSLPLFWHSRLSRYSYHPSPSRCTTKTKSPSLHHHQPRQATLSYSQDCLYPSTTFGGTQESGRSSYEVSVTIMVRILHFYKKQLKLNHDDCL
ncbi:hypothetical protein BU17DRAFT_99257 [Hysterangium stoloniferum]|nr:hypothetical protein BU17DRAFT_99257 [Hysterangium stoloniferum]